MVRAGAASRRVVPGGCAGKTLTLSDYRQYLQKYWRALNMYMENHQTGKRTRLVYSDYRFRTGLSDRDFTRNVLKRGR